jgi:hypothetical protein
MTSSLFPGFTDGCAAAGHPVSGVTSGGSGSASSGAAKPSGTGATSSSGTGAASPSGTGAATTKGSGAIAQMTVSILGAVFAVAVGGVAFA